MGMNFGFCLPAIPYEVQSLSLNERVVIMKENGGFQYFNHLGRRGCASDDNELTGRDILPF